MNNENNLFQFKQSVFIVFYDLFTFHSCGKFPSPIAFNQSYISEIF